MDGGGSGVQNQPAGGGSSGAAEWGAERAHLYFLPGMPHNSLYAAFCRGLGKYTGIFTHPVQFSRTLVSMLLKLCILFSLLLDRHAFCISVLLLLLLLLQLATP